MNLEQAKQLGYELRLYGIQAHLERRAAEAVSQQFHPLEFLHLVLRDELLARKDRGSKRLATRGRFRTSVELEDWDSTFDRGRTIPEPCSQSLKPYPWHLRGYEPSAPKLALQCATLIAWLIARFSRAYSQLN